MVGILTALIDLLLNIPGGFSIWAVVSLVLAVAGGWVGGKLSSK